MKAYFHIEIVIKKTDILPEIITLCLKNMFVIMFKNIKIMRLRSFIHTEIGYI